MSTIEASAASTDVLTSNGHRLDPSPRRLGRLEPVPDAERHDRAALRRRLARDGFLFLPGFLDRAEILEFRRYYFAALEGTGVTAPGSDPLLGRAAYGGLDREAMRRALFRDIVPGPEYEALCRHPRIAGFYRWLLEAEEVHLHRRKLIRHVGPGESGVGTATQAHYDLVYLREGTGRVLSSWIPLGDCPIARGPLIYLEGSHHRVLAEEAAGTLRRPAASITADLPALAEEYDARWLVTGFRAGDMVVHNAYVIHASLDNADPEGLVRLSTDIRYQSATEVIDPRWQNHWAWDDGL
ncbi:phytanoyl-CoA dioxygenase family protein [Nonomuraea sp. NPDC050790]|uniref:phytanoyl-CoA dioxygenase family protein n=1 Tax=Nonomuraea sp. NPDC050790 TaxID=3364371 RepID=UPI003788EC98